MPDLDLLTLAQAAEWAASHPELAFEGAPRLNFADDQAIAKAAATRFDEVQRTFARNMHGVLDDLQAGHVTGAQATTKMGKMISTAHQRAYFAGKEWMTGAKSVLNADDWFFLKRSVEYERGFLTRFVDDVVHGRGKMNYSTRLDLYVGTIQAPFNNAALEYSPEDAEILWTLGLAEHCEDCLSLEAMNPWTRASLPTVPGAGDSRCMTSESGQIRTRRGMVSVRDVSVGDEVLTHRGQWRQVSAKPVNRSTDRHRYAVLVTERGLVGFTADHRMWTDAGWETAEEVARADLRVLPALQSAKAQDQGDVLQVMRPSEFRDEDADLLGVRGLRGKAEVAGLRAAVSEMPREDAAPQVPGSARGTLRDFVEPTARSPQGGDVLARRQTAADLSVPLGVDQGAWSDTAGPRNPSPRRGSDERRPGKSAVVDAIGARSAAPQRGEKLELDRGSADADVLNLRCGIQTVRQGWAGEEVLLQAVCGCRPGETGEPSGDCLRNLRGDVRAIGSLEAQAQVLQPEMLRCEQNEPGAGLGVQELRPHFQRSVGSRPGTSVLQPGMLERAPGEYQDGDGSLRDVRDGVQDRRIESGQEQVGPAFLLSDLCRRRTQGESESDPCVQLLREDLSQGKVADRIVEVGQVILLAGVLPPGSPLYDLTVEEDHSFEVNGLVVHNCGGRCKCHLEYQRRPKGWLKSQVKQQIASRPGSLANMFSLPPLPRGFTIPTAAERASIESIRQEMNYWRRAIQDAHVAGDELAKREAIRMRAAANDELIKFTEKNKLWAPPALSVDDVLSGKMLDDRLMQEVFNHGLDGATVAGLPDAIRRQVVQDLLQAGAAADAKIATTLKPKGGGK